LQGWYTTIANHGREFSNHCCAIELNGVLFSF
jgi:hypothetical protein